MNKQLNAFQVLLLSNQCVIMSALIDVLEISGVDCKMLTVGVEATDEFINENGGDTSIERWNAS